MAPINETPAIEFKLGSRESITAQHVNTKNHSTVVNDLAPQVDPQTIWKKSFADDPPMTIKATQVPPERYMIGNNPSRFAVRSPKVRLKSCMYRLYRTPVSMFSWR